VKQIARADLVANDSKASEVSERYALALFGLARDSGEIAAVEQDLKSLKAMLADSADLRTLVGSPKFGADDKAEGLAAVAQKAGLCLTVRNFLGVLSANGRAGALSAVISSFEKLAAEHRGAISAEVVTAVPLSAKQTNDIAAALRQALGKDPEIETRVDPSILGGMKVLVGSRLYDASLKSKLDQLKFALKRA
jgi:F-type H+-transporting ATPase subunit delta